MNTSGDSRVSPARVIGLLVAVIVIVASVSGVAHASTDVSLVVNGETVVSDVSPRIVSDRTLVPVRFVSENLGWNVE